MDRGFICYLEYEIYINHSPKDRHCFVVDILACREKEKILIEVGTLSHKFAEDRLAELKKLVPEATIWHITQWKNWMTSFDWLRVNEEARWSLYRFRSETEDVFGKW